jgi:methionine biosynthesis protein MetW
MQTWNVLKVWYQNDWGRYARRDERLVRELIAHEGVDQVLHVEPPVAANFATLSDVERRDPLGWTRRRLHGVQDGKLSLWTPAWSSGDSLEGLWQGLEDQLQRCGMFSKRSLLWISAPGFLGDWILQRFGLRFTAVVAEVEDDHRHYAEPRSEARLALQCRYERAVRAADLLVSNSRAMLREWQLLQPQALHLGNAVDATEYDRVAAAPHWLQKQGRPIFTYVGNLRLRLRVDLLQAVVSAFPQATLVLAGEGAEALPATLAQAANVVLPGPVPAAEVPALLMNSDVLLLPHVVNDFTESMDPQKLYEYLASGRPIVATPVAGAREQQGRLQLADSPDCMVSAVAEALRNSLPPVPGSPPRSQIVATWRQRVDRLLAALEELPELGLGRRQESALQYFEHDRPEIRELVPHDSRRILDIGCGAGALGRALRWREERYVAGIEKSDSAALRARQRLDQVWAGSCEEILPQLADHSFDAVILADILEHLQQPEDLLQEVHRVLTDDGVLVVSLPNVGHWSVIQQLLQGEFRMEEAGILDRTHLRFYTRRSAERLLVGAQFQILAHRGSRWAQEGPPASVVQHLQAANLVSPAFAAEANWQQNLFVARPTSAVLPVAAPASRTPTSVIIPVWNAEEYTRSCLQQLQRWKSRGVAEVIVIDNGSGPATARVLTDFPGTVVLRNEENLGFAAAVNQGLRQAQHPLLCILNNDTLLTEGWLDPLRAALENTDRAVLAGPCTNYANGVQQIDLGEVQDEKDIHTRAADWCSRHRGVIEDTDFLSGFCMFGRREELLEVGGFAEAYGRGTFEDGELSRRIRRSGRRLLVVRDSLVYHFGNRTFCAAGIDLDAQQKVNQALFYERHSEDPVVQAQCEARKGHLPQTLRLCLDALRREPADLDARLVSAQVLARLGRPEAALRMIRAYARLCPLDPRIRKLEQALEQLSGSTGGGRKDFLARSPLGTSD